jgi:hypothetical protein
VPAEFHASAYLLNFLHLILDEGQHGPFDVVGGWDCVNGIWADFLDRGGLDGLDTSCADDLPRQSFLLDEAAFTRHLEATLAPLI